MENTWRKIISDFAKHVSSGKARFFQKNEIDFVFGKREGPFVWDVDGSCRLIDCHCNGGVFNLGHRNPVLIETLVQAVVSLDIGNHHFVSRSRSELAKQIAAYTPGDLRYTIFGVSGGEAVDTAIKIARKSTRRKKIISAHGGYHGHTGLALAAGDAKYREPFLSSSEDFLQIPFDDVAALDQAVSSRIAAVILETIPATLGMTIPNRDYFSYVKKVCEQNAALLIIDEVQTGLGRTGKMWGIEYFGVEPDILVIGKGLSGGIYPITATVIQPELEQVFHDDPFSHISTFGGAEIGCAVAQKVLEMSAATEFLQHVNTLAEIFNTGLQKIQQSAAGFLIEIRQKGLMMGLKMAAPQLGPLMTKACFEAGLLCVFAGNDPSVVQFLPPLNIEKPLADEILQRLTRALEIAAQANLNPFRSV
ncbi:MAG: aspartate aminotransferase family protein [bacterium]